MTENEGDEDYFKKALELVEPENREAFTRFVSVGEAPEAYLVHIDECKTCQSAAESIFTVQNQAIAELEKLYHKDCCEAGKSCRPPQPTKFQRFVRWTDQVMPYLMMYSLGFLTGILFLSWMMLDQVRW